MRSEEQMKFSQRYARFSSQPQSLLGKLLTLVLCAEAGCRQIPSSAMNATVHRPKRAKTPQQTKLQLS
jgi:hypothetical protein